VETYDVVIVGYGPVGQLLTRAGPPWLPGGRPRTAAGALWAVGELRQVLDPARPRRLPGTTPSPTPASRIRGNRSDGLNHRSTA